jgi:glycosyltransferase involved in cell wall biosynthesis
VKIAHVLAGNALLDVANGVRKYVYFMAKAQAELGLHVAVFSLSTEPETPIPGVFVRSFSRARWPFRVPVPLLAEIERWRPDILHLHSPYFPPNVALAHWARRRGVPYVITPHGALSPGEIRERWYLKAPYKHLFELPALNRAAFVHAVGAGEELTTYGVTAPIQLAPGGVDVSTLPRAPMSGALAARHPALEQRRVFVFLGRLDPAQKGLDLLVEAFTAARLDKAALVLVGPDYRGGRRRLGRLLARLQPQSPVLILDPVYGTERLEVLTGADVFVNTARWEGMPMAVLEAAAAGRACLLTPPADPLGRLAQSGAAISVAPRVDAIVAGLRHMSEVSTDELARMGQRARAVVTSDFQWSESARLLAEAYARYANAGRRVAFSANTGRQGPQLDPLT